MIENINNINALKLAAELLKLSFDEVKKHSHIIDGESSLLYVSEPVKGGNSLIIDVNTLEFLYANSSVRFEDHLVEFKKGRRNKKEDFDNYF